jgi:Tfp pilus assembly protein PilV
MTTQPTPSNPETPRGREAGFTLVEALVAIVVLIFGLMAVTNLLLVAASSNTVANQGTAAVTSATQVMDFLKATTFDLIDDAAGGGAGGTTFDATDGGKDCSDVTLVPTDWHCAVQTPGVGTVHVHWYITAMADPRLVYIRVRAEGSGALAAARSRAEFTTFRACTNSDPATGGCPNAP